MKRLLTVLLTFLLICSSLFTANSVKAEGDEITEEPVNEVIQEETVEPEEKLNGTELTVLDSNSEDLTSNYHYTVYSDYSMVISGTGDVSLNSDSDPITDLYASVRSITIQSGINQIGDDAFKNYTSLLSVAADPVEDVGARAFEGCTSLKTVKLSSSTLTIGDNAFKDDIALEMVFVASTSTIVSANEVDSPFYGCPDGVIYTDASEKSDNWTDVFNAISLTQNSYVHYNTPAADFDYWAGIKGQSRVVIPGTIEVLPDGVFMNNTTLEEVVIPSSIVTIPDDCFNGCTNLEEIYISSSVTSIGKRAFKGCSSLETMIIPSSVTSITAEDVSESPFYGCSEELYVYLDLENDISNYDSYWNYRDEDNSIYYGTFHEFLDDFIYEYDADSDSYMIVGTVGYENILTIPQSYPEFDDGKAVTAIKANAFNGNNSITTLNIPTTITAIEENAFVGASNLTTINYGGTKEEWDAMDIEGEEAILNSRNITFSNGVHDYQEGITVYQNTDKDLIIEADSDFLEDLATPTLRNYSDNNHIFEDGGNIEFWINSSCNRFIGNLTNISGYDQYVQTVERNFIVLSDDHTKAVVSYDSLCTAYISSNLYQLHLCTEDEVKVVSLYIEGLKQLTEEPTVSLLENGDIKIEASEDYLNGLVRFYNYYDYACTSAQRAIKVSTEYKEDEYESCGVTNMHDSIVGTVQPLTLSKDHSYVLFSNAAQRSLSNGEVIVNGPAKISLYSFGYEPSYDHEVTLTKNYEPAPDDAVASYENGFISITSSNTLWLSQLESFMLVSTDATEFGNTRTEYSLQNCRTLKDNTLTASLIGQNIDDGTYYPIISGPGWVDYSDSTFRGSANNTILPSVTIENVPSRKSIDGNYTVSFTKTRLEIRSSNSLWLDALCEEGSSDLTDEELMNASGCPQDAYIAVMIDENDYVLFRNTEENEVIHRGDGLVYINLSDLEDAGMKIYKGMYYRTRMYGFAYNVAYAYSITSSYAPAISALPSDLKIKEDANGNVVVTTKNNTFLNNIRYISIYDDEYIVTILPNEIAVENGKATIPAEYVLLNSGTYDVTYYSYGFKYTYKTNALKLTHDALEEAPEFTLSIGEDGEFVIESEDENWIQLLSDEGNPYRLSRVAMIRKVDSTSPYADSLGHIVFLHSNIKTVDENTVAVSASNQRISNILNGIYKVQFRVPGYIISDVKEIEFTDALNDIPNDLEVEKIGNIIRVSTDDSGFIESINPNNNTCVYTKYASTYNSRVFSSSYSWPIEVGNSGGYGASGVWGTPVTVTRNISEGYVDFDISSVTMSNSNIYVLHIAMVYGSNYRYVDIPINVETYEIRYHNNLDDSDPTEGDSSIARYYTKNLENFTYKLPTLSKRGYSFNGWYSDANYKKKVTSLDMKKCNGDIDLYAKFTLIKYTVKYNLNGGKNDSANPTFYTIDEGKGLADPTRTGYVFNGWYTTKTFDEGTEMENIALGSVGNITLYAKWTPITYTIRYESNEYSSIDYTVSYNENFKLSDVILPKPGMKAQKYTYSINGKEKTVAATSAIKNLVSVNNTDTIVFKVAKDKYGNELWSRATYTITYNLNGGTNSSKNKKSYTMGSSFLLENPSKKGYEFISWTDEEGNTVTSINTADFGNRVYTANWSVINYSITFNASEGTLPEDYESGSIIYTVEDTITLLNPTRANHTFAGWYKGKTKVTSIKKGSIGNITLTAKWTEGTNYTVVYDKNDSSATGKMSTTKVTAGKNVALTNNAYKLTGKVFVEWNTKADGTGLSFKNKDTLLKSAPLSMYGNETITLYAIWDDVYSFNIHFNANTGNGTMKSLSMSNKAYKALTANTFKKPGYSFVCWNSEPDGSGMSYKNKEVFWKYNKGGADVTLYAIWTPIVYKITYKNMKSTDINPNPTTYTILDDDIILSNPQRNGYCFAGWYTDSKYKNRIESIDTESLKSYTLYPKWTKE